jgi:hypothetical protein
MPHHGMGEEARGAGLLLDLAVVHDLALGLDGGDSGHAAGGDGGGDERHQDTFEKPGICLDDRHWILSSHRLADRQLKLERTYTRSHDPGLNGVFILRS